MSKQPIPPPPGDRPVRTAPPPPPRWRLWLWPIALGLTFVLFLFLPAIHSRSVVTLSYSQFIADTGAHKIKTVTFASSTGNTPASGTLTNGKSYTTIIPGQPTPALNQQLTAAGVQITASAPSSGFGTQLLSWLILLLPLLFVFYLFRRMARSTGSPLGGVLGVGRSRAKVFDAERPQTKFSDVAGYEGAKAEIAEVIDFLRNPGRYQRAGAMAPRGVLMIGPPGTGKTLLARAVAGEASVPFFSVSGSSFVEMFVGVGAARVRDLFAEARKRAPAIIFVDELDAIGQRRSGAGAVVSNDEREQTLNQLLSEMDGFDMAQGIVVLAATNRPEILDPALLRPGRFDRQVIIPLPTLTERAAILAVHCRGKRLASDVDLNVVARGTPGFSGADLANLANEAAIVAVRDNREVLTAADFGAARDRILLGRREGSNVLLPEEKQAVAVHEAGHAIVAALSDHADPVAKVTILPAGQTLGVTEQLPLVERASVRPGLSHRIPCGAARRPRRRARRDRPGLDRRGQRPGQRHRSGDQDGARVRPVTGAWPGRLPRGRVGVPGRRRPWPVQPAVRRNNPGHHRRRGRPAAARGRAIRRDTHPRAPRRTRPARRAAAGKGNRGRRGRLPDSRQASTRAPAPGAGDRPTRPVNGEDSGRERIRPGAARRTPAPAPDRPDGQRDGMNSLPRRGKCDLPPHRSAGPDDNPPAR
jgi:cell division protease FtsH